MPCSSSKTREELTYHGLLLRCRIEQQEEGPKLVVTLDKKGNDGISQIVKDHSKRKIAIPKRLRGEERKVIAAELMSTYFKRMLSVKKVSDPILREALIAVRAKLPLAIVLDADWDGVETETDWESATKKRNRNAVRQLVTMCGDTALEEVSPQHIRSLLMSSGGYSNAALGAVIRRLMRYELLLGAIDRNPWERETLPARRQTPENSAKKLVETYIEPTMLQNCHLYSIVADCHAALVNAQKPNLHYLGAMLLFCTPMRPEEICALSVGQVLCLSERRDDLAVQITHERAVRGKQFVRRELRAPERKRLVPLPTMVAEVILQLSTSEHAQFVFGDADWPLICDRKNRERFLQPPDFLKWMLQRWPQLRDYASTATELKSVAKNTVWRNLEKVSVEQEELRYLRGLTPNATLESNYWDFKNSLEQYKLIHLQNRWLENLRTETGAQTSAPVALTTRAQTVAVPGRPGCMINEQVTITIAPKQPGVTEDVVVRVGAPRGLRFVQAELGGVQ